MLTLFLIVGLILLACTHVLLLFERKSPEISPREFKVSSKLLFSAETMFSTMIFIVNVLVIS